MAAMATSLLILGSVTANAGITVLGAQYHPDRCSRLAATGPLTVTQTAHPRGGATVHVYLKNTGTSAVTVNDTTLAGTA